MNLINDDNGKVSVYDIQYALFNIIAIADVIAIFAQVPRAGFPQIPGFLTILTGGAALTYTVTKGTNVPADSRIIARPLASCRRAHRRQG
jgi:hypothetical protein